MCGWLQPLFGLFALARAASQYSAAWCTLTATRPQWRAVKKYETTWRVVQRKRIEGDIAFTEWRPPPVDPDQADIFYPAEFSADRPAPSSSLQSDPLVKSAWGNYPRFPTQHDDTVIEVKHDEYFQPSTISTEAPSFSVADLEPMMYNGLQVLAKRHGILHRQSGQALRDALGALVEIAGPSTEIPGQPMIPHQSERDHIAEAAAELASMEAGELQP